MAQPPSPSASSVLLPFLSPRERRGSLASITSRKEIDKGALAQVLDQIHTSAYKSETLTSFHDFDGGARPGAKDLVSNGVSGFYNRLKQSVTGSGGAEKERPRSRGSRVSAETESVQSVISSGRAAPAPAAPSLSSRKQGTDTTSASASTVSVAASPVLATFSANGALFDPQSQGENGQPSSAETATTSVKEGTSVKDYGHDKNSVTAASEEPSLEDLERALHDDDHNATATQALARVLSHHEISLNDRVKQPRALNSSDADNGNLMSTDTDTPANLATTAITIKSPTFSTDDIKSPRDSPRPPMVHIGPSHLPGWDPSRRSSLTDLADAVSSSSTQTGTRKPALEPSPNLNTALQRKRATAKESHTSTRHSPTAHVPHHLKRRVISKEFWMKDENAKDCFSCGQSFSTFRRKHHCRTCGQIFDSKCTSLVPGRPFGQPGTLRLCKPCEAMIYGDDDDSTVFSDDAEEFSRSPVAQRSSMYGGDDMDGMDFSRPEAGEVMTPSIGIPASRRTREAKRRSAVIEFDAQPTLARPSSSHSLISTARRPRSSSHKRHHSRHANVRGLRSSVDERGPFHQEVNADPEKKNSLPAFHKDNIIDPDLAQFMSDEGSEEDEPPSIISALESGVSPGERDRLGFSSLLAAATKKGRSRAGDRGTAPSSVKAVKEVESVGHALKGQTKQLRRRNLSEGSSTIARPSPRRSRSNLLVPPAETTTTLSRPTTPIEAPPGGCKLIRSSAMHGSDAPPVELNRASLEHVRRLLAQLLRDSNVEAAAAWERALLPILLQCTDDVQPDVQRGDDMDIRHYIKLKKVPGGKPGDTSYVSGVVFSKNVALKSMARSISNPRIAIITFSIEYARHQTHFMSLDPVIAQEREYLNNLVGRIAALKPQLLLVQKNVSGLALRLLEQAGITVAFNIKESVLAAVARVTRTTMIRSVDKLTIDPSHLGRCDSFEVKTYMSQGTRKTYIFLSGCQKDLGCTIVLRGADTKALRQIKRITEFMCYVVYNLRLETTLMRDEFVALPASTQTQLAAHDNANSSVGHDALVASTSDTPSVYANLEKEIQSRILSASPFVKFMQPYLLTKLREQEGRLATYKTLRDQYAAADEQGDDEKPNEDHFAIVKPEMVSAPPSKEQPKAVREYLHAVHEAQYEKTMHAYETQKRLWEAFRAGGVKPFDPFSHQNIAVLHSVVSRITSVPCSGPEVLGIGFYQGYSRAEPHFGEDCTLGQYVEDLCLSAGSTCKVCSKKMHEHHRQYVHGYGTLSVSVERQRAKLGLNQSILMWSTCRICRAETPVVPMSENTWRYSFAKYLELSFWSVPLHARAGLCEHDIHKDFVRFFGFQNMVVRIQYEPIDTYDIVVPRSTITWKVESDLTVKNEQYMHCLNRLNAFTESVKKRLNSINVDTLDEKRVVEAHEKIDMLRKRIETDHAELLAKLQQKYTVSRYYELIPLNRALRLMDERAIAWDEEFNNFERDYFPSETDIRKLATLQLRNMFLESQPTISGVTSDASDTEDGTELVLMAKEARPEMPSEKAEDVMTSTALEHRGLTTLPDGPPSMPKEKSEEMLGPNLSRRLSPQEERDAVDRDDVKHLDLAVPARSPDGANLDELSPQEAASRTVTVMQAEQGAAETFATQPKPLSSGLLERIEQIRSHRAAENSDGTDLPESKIPRPVDRKRQESGLTIAPPLLRAQSQPSGAHWQSLDANVEPDSESSTVVPPSPEPQTADKRLGKKVSMNRIVSKIGKVAPSLIPRSVPFKTEEAHNNNVSALARHFEMMSREFEKERLRERRQRALRSRQARANPLASSRPIVEIYRNATEAVGEKAADTASHEKIDGITPQATHEATPLPEQPAQEAIATTESDDMEEHPRRAETFTTASSTDTTAQSSYRDSSQDTEDSDVDTMSTRQRDTSEPSEPSDPTTATSSSLLSPTSLPDSELSADISIPEHRKNVWFKYLADFWSKRSASGWTNLEYPLHATEHVFEDSDIIVREDEPSSVIALSLASADYLNKVAEFRGRQDPSRQTRKHAHTASQTSSINMEYSDQDSAIEASLLSDTGTHMKYSFAHGSVKASCKIFYAEAFDALRRRCGVADRFVESMSRCLKYDSKGGKTKSLFLKTLDGRFIIKSLQEVELRAFTKFAPDYFAFMSYTLFHGVPSVIAKMFGLFQVTIKNPGTGMDFSYYLLVMENLFYERNPNRRFDLKGSMRNRKIEKTGQPDEVLLDENLVETIFESPLFVREHARRLLQASVWNDTLWLCKQNVMDYSLMAGFDDDRKELVVGIIDCIRTYTWDKKLESWIKDRGKNKPTITSPKDYRNRFRVSMMQYALSAPTPWHQFQTRMTPPKTLKEREEKEEEKEEMEETDTEVERRSEETKEERSLDE